MQTRLLRKVWCDFWKSCGQQWPKRYLTLYDVSYTSKFDFKEWHQVSIRMFQFITFSLKTRWDCLCNELALYVTVILREPWKFPKSDNKTHTPDMVYALRITKHLEPNLRNFSIFTLLWNLSLMLHVIIFPSVSLLSYNWACCGFSVSNFPIRASDP